jgi:hypothetical protein
MKAKTLISTKREKKRLALALRRRDRKKTKL